ncbi:MAG TPA: ImmA/IrrE family metallo-endopeptidase, partial [Piscirickettsiaceae bacterium]|nr:ImmA/IrrE family metallo-endopeptidase [Piscirickettsiaceae bacterium]
NFAGAIIKGDNGKKHYILVNIYDSYERQRFTITHELGHLLLDNTETIDCR